MTDARPPTRLTGLSKLVLVIWAARCVLAPAGLLWFTSPLTPWRLGAAMLLAAVSASVGVAYALRVRIAWRLLQVCLIAGWVLAGWWGNHVVFIGEAAVTVFLYFSLYDKEVRAEFDVHATPREVGVLLVLMAMCAVLDILRPQLIHGENLGDLVRQFSTVGVMAVGMAMVIILGGIDLSVGSVVALSGVLAAKAYCALAEAGGWTGAIALPAAVGVALTVGAGVGAFNGALVSRFRMAPFIITLGTMSMARSLTNVITRGWPVVPGPRIEQALKDLAWDDTLGVPNPVWIMAGVMALGHVFLTRMRTGRHVYYIGANEEAARLSGLNVTAVKCLVYTICGLLAGLAGIMQAARMASGQVSAGLGDELQVIAAVIIGGASFSGGEGTVLGALVGAAIMGVLRQGQVLLGIGTYWQGFVEGAVIIGAVALDTLRRRRSPT